MAIVKPAYRMELLFGHVIATQGRGGLGGADSGAWGYHGNTRLHGCAKLGADGTNPHANLA